MSIGLDLSKITQFSNLPQLTDEEIINKMTIGEVFHCSGVLKLRLGLQLQIESALSCGMIEYCSSEMLDLSGVFRSSTLNIVDFARY